MSKIKCLLYSIFIVAALGCLGGCSFGWKVNYIYQNGEKYTAGNREITDRIETIDIDYMSGNVTLIGTDSNVITITETAAIQLDDKRKVHTWVDGTTLYVRYCASAKNLDLSNLKKNLKIMIPEGVKLSDVKVKDSSGDVVCSDFDTENFIVSVSSGDVSVSCKAGKLKIHASSGDIALVQKGESEEIDLSSSSGKINADLENAESVKVSASSGKVKINADTIHEFESKVSSGTGDYFFAKTPEKSNISHSSGDTTIYLPKECDLTGDFDTSSGKLFYDLAFSRVGDQYVCGTGANQMKVHVSSGNINLKVLEAE